MALPNPKGWHTLPVEVVFNGRTLLIVGEPPGDDPESESHRCDSMGCGQGHILARISLDGPAREGLRHLLIRARAQNPPEPGPSLREQVLARLGRVKDEEVAIYD